jgi:hypothetical protein
MPLQLYDTVSILEGAGKIAQGRGEHFGYVQHQFFSLVEPDLEGLSARDVATLSSYTHAVCQGHSAASISHVTHNTAWEVAQLGEEIPFAAFLAAAYRGQATSSELADIEAALGA